MVEVQAALAQDLLRVGEEVVDQLFLVPLARLQETPREVRAQVQQRRHLGIIRIRYAG